MVGKRGFEPPTPASRTPCSTRLSHFPNFLYLYYFEGNNMVLSRLTVHREPITSINTKHTALNRTHTFLKFNIVLFLCPPVSPDIFSLSIMTYYQKVIRVYTKSRK